MCTPLSGLRTRVMVTRGASIPSVIIIATRLARRSRGAILRSGFIMGVIRSSAMMGVSLRL